MLARGLSIVCCVLRAACCVLCAQNTLLERRQVVESPATNGFLGGIGELGRACMTTTGQWSSGPRGRERQPGRPPQRAQKPLGVGHRAKTHCDSCWTRETRNRTAETETGRQDPDLCLSFPVSLSPVLVIVALAETLQRYFVGTRVFMRPGPLRADEMMPF